jgi:hypothetical protein
MQLAEQFEAEDLAAQAAAQQQAADPFDNPMEGSDDDDWAEIARTSSMEGVAGSTGRPRPSSQAAAAAGTTAGGLVGAGLSALLAMAAQAAANRAQQAASDAQAEAQRTQASGGPSTSAAAAGGQQSTAAGSAGAAGAGDEDGSSSTGVLGMAANALRSFLASRAANQAGSSGAAAGSSGQHGAAEAERRWVSMLAARTSSRDVGHVWCPEGFVTAVVWLEMFVRGMSGTMHSHPCAFVLQYQVVAQQLATLAAQ